MFSSPPQAGFQTERASLMSKYTHYTSKIPRQREKRGGRNIPTHLIKVRALHSIRRVCCTFPPTFGESKSESTKSLFACIINALGVREVARSCALNPNLYPTTWGNKKSLWTSSGSMRAFKCWIFDVPLTWFPANRFLKDQARAAPCVSWGSEVGAVFRTFSPPRRVLLSFRVKSDASAPAPIPPPPPPPLPAPIPPPPPPPARFLSNFQTSCKNMNMHRLCGESICETEW